MAGPTVQYGREPILKPVKDGIGCQNPIVCQALGICSALAVTAYMNTTLVMCSALLFVASISSLLVSIEGADTLVSRFAGPPTATAAVLSVAMASRLTVLAEG